MIRQDNAEKVHFCLILGRSSYWLHRIIMTPRIAHLFRLGEGRCTVCATGNNAD
jgi:hypothetical protein